MPAYDVVQAEVLFHALDIDDNGSVEVEELRLWAGMVGAPWATIPLPTFLETALLPVETAILDPAQFAMVWKVWGGWEVEAGDLRAAVEQGMSARSLAEPNDEVLEAAFAAIDRENLGYIDLDTLVVFGVSIGAGWSEEGCKQLLGKMDANGDERIDFSEFETFIAQVGLHGDQGQVAAFVDAGRAALEDRERQAHAQDI